MSKMITKREAEVLTAIAEDEYTELNGGEPDTVEQCVTYAFSAVSSKSDGGVLTSLIKKDLAFHDPQPFGVDLVGLTELGFKAYKESKK